MPIDPGAFLLVLARVGGAFAFAPLPGIRSAPEVARIVLSLGFALALYPLCPRWPGGGPWTLAAALIAEAGIGLGIGCILSFAAEGLAVALQIAGLQAGYGYASTIDPTTQADSTVWLTLGNLFSGLVFFALDLHLVTWRAFAGSLAWAPPGEFPWRLAQAGAWIDAGAAMLVTGVRMALPLVALLVLVDLALALLGRINAHLQLLTLAFPVKMLLGLLVLTATLALWPRVFGEVFRKLLLSLPH